MSLKKYFIEKFKNKKILILGFAREGKSTLNVFNKYLPYQKIDVADKEIDKNYLKSLKKYDIVFKSPGIPNKLVEIQDAKSSGVLFTSQTKIFLEIYKDRIIGVTGTKGKSTTSSLIFHILKTYGKNVYLVGNIGKPVFDYLQDYSESKVFVAELSSHQLSDVDHSPHIAVLLNIYPEHLDYYESFEDYKRAKMNIHKFQTKKDYFISPTIIKKIKLPVFKSNLIGDHNIYNIKAAYAVSKITKVPDTVFLSALMSFKPLSERLETVAKINEVEFILDGLATIPEASLAAVDSFPTKAITLILGGFDRGLNFDIFVKELLKRKNVQNIILIGQVAEKLDKLLENSNINVQNMGFSDMNDIVKKAFEMSKKDYIVLFSPGATSFDMFKSYEDRDKHFKDAVKLLI